jgi:hypothetical protein
MLRVQDGVLESEQADREEAAGVECTTFQRRRAG